MKNASLDIYYSRSLCPGRTYLEQTWVKPKGKYRNSCTQTPSAMSKYISVKQWLLFNPMSLGQWCSQGHGYLIWGYAVCQWSTPFYQNFKVSTPHPLSAYTLVFMPTLIICGDQWKETLNLRFWMMSPKQTVLTSRKEKNPREVFEPIKTLKLGIITLSLGDDERNKAPMVQTDNTDHSHQGAPGTGLHILKSRGPNSEMDLLRRAWVGLDSPHH